MRVELHQVSAYNEALRCYEKGLELNPKNGEIWCKKGLTYHNLGKNEKAEYCYKEAIKLNSNNDEAIYYLGFLKMQVVKYNKAVKLFKRAISVNNNNDMAYYYLTKALIKNNERVEAKEILIRKMMETYPNIGSMILIAYGELQRSREEYRSNISKIEHLVEILKRKIGVKELLVMGLTQNTTKNIKTISVITGANNV